MKSEKGRAREIYNSYKQQRRDPGLLEQVDYKTFEMRIFPINAGAEQNVAPGMVFAVYRKGEALTDPGTGTVLEVEMTRLGRLRVDTVREKVSVASLIDGPPPARGDLLRAE